MLSNSHSLDQFAVQVTCFCPIEILAALKSTFPEIASSLHARRNRTLPRTCGTLHCQTQVHVEGVCSPARIPGRSGTCVRETACVLASYSGRVSRRVGFDFIVQMEMWLAVVQRSLARPVCKLQMICFWPSEILAD